MITFHREFLRAYSRLNESEKSSILATLSRLQQDEVTPGMRIHDVGDFLSISPNMDIRIICVRQASGYLLFYADHHDKAYSWAERRKPIDLGDSVEPLVLSDLIKIDDKEDSDVPKIPFIIRLLGQQAVSEDQLLNLIVEISPEWQEWIFRVFIEKEQPHPALPITNSFLLSASHDDALRRALNLATFDWLLFAHPSQQEVLDDKVSQSIGITGGPGTGKSVVLLRRFIESDGNSILFTYSRDLAQYLSDILDSTNQERGKGEKFILPLFCLTGVKPYNEKNAQALLNKFKVTVDSGSINLIQNGSSTYRIDEILVDEIQDAEEASFRILKEVLEARKTRLVVAGDIHQTIHRANFDILTDFLNKLERTEEFSYCYRSSKQILSAAREITAELTEIGDNYSSEYGLTGVPLTLIETADLSSQVKECETILKEFATRYPEESLALIYLQYFNPAFKGGSREEAALKNHPYLKQFYKFASTTKGKEFMAGVVFVSESFLAKDMGENATRLRANTLFVSVTRFREEVVLVYPAGCSIQSALTRAANNFSILKV